MVARIMFSAHATIKLQMLNKHGFKVGNEDIVIVTFYPARRERYEDKV
jgi:hypothetical protein